MASVVAYASLALAEYSVPTPRRKTLPVIEAVSPGIHQLIGDGALVCQAALDNDGHVCDSCYSGPSETTQMNHTLRVDGVTLDCSSSDEHVRLQSQSHLEHHRYSPNNYHPDYSSPEEIYLDKSYQPDAHTFHHYHSEDTQDDENLTDSQGSLDREIDRQLEGQSECQDSLDSSSTSSLSCDGDSVIYVEQREAFKCIEELLVTAQDSLCVHNTELEHDLHHSNDDLHHAAPAEACDLHSEVQGEEIEVHEEDKEDKEEEQGPQSNSYVSFSPPSLDRLPALASRAGSADSGVASQAGSSPLSRRSTEPGYADQSTSGNHQGTRVSAVVAIDVGTTHSGYAYCVCREPGREVHIMRRSEGGEGGMVNHKVPTALLLTPQAAFHSFGVAARDYFHDLPPHEARRWLYFERFKMTLHRDSELHRDTPISATNGKTQPAIVVFAHSLRYFHELAVRELSERCAQGVAPQEVRWVLTVPAIWRQPARQLVREAAYQAGMCSPEHPDRLLVVLEPEAAAVQCRQQLLDARGQRRRNTTRSSTSSSSGSTSSEPEEPLLEQPTRFLVADCGGGTVDITLHELAGEEGALRELVPAAGGPCGSTGVDQEFEQLLCSLFGASLMSQFKERRPAAYAELLTSFEGRKRSAGGRDAPVNLFPPFAFVDYLRKHSGKDVEHAVKKSGRRDISWSREGVLRLQSAAMLELFKATVDKVIEHIGAVLDSVVLNDQPAQQLFMVGGFSESHVLQRAVKDAFGSRVQIVSPQPSSLSTLRGAVLYGLDSGVISARRAKHSYGVGVLKRFVPGLHPADKLVVSRDGVRWCADVLDCFVSAGQRLVPGHAETRRYVAARAGQNTAVLHVYCATTGEVGESEAKPRFVTDPGVSRCGSLTLTLQSELDLDPNAKQRDLEDGRREVTAQMFFSGAELVVSAVDATTGRCVRVDLDFLAAD